MESQALAEGRIVEFQRGHPSTLVRGPGKYLVSCGELFSKDALYWPGMVAKSGSVVIVHPKTMEECADGTVGEMWITGKCVTGGYWSDATQTERGEEAGSLVAGSDCLAHSLTYSSVTSLSSLLSRRNAAGATSAAYSARLSQAHTATGLSHSKSSFYRTGDLGVIWQGQIYVTGRLKEMIIVNGTKHYPMDIEAVVQEVSRCRACVRGAHPCCDNTVLK